MLMALLSLLQRSHPRQVWVGTASNRLPTLSCLEGSHVLVLNSAIRKETTSHESLLLRVWGTTTVRPVVVD